MLKEKKKLLVYLIALIVVLLAIIILIVWHACRSKAPELPAAAVTPRPTQQVIVRQRPVEKIIEKIVEVEKEISVEEIRSGLNDMGVLLTEEYCFTQVVHYSSAKKIFSIELGFTETSYLVSYDGVVSAGVDFSSIRLERDDEHRIIRVIMPSAQIHSVDIDPESFVLHSEKTGLGNPLSVEDVNTSLVELESSAREKALARGVLERADENARLIVANFISGLTDTTSWSIRFEKA